MASRLQDFREQYPQYEDLPDEQLGEALRKKHYADMDPARFRATVGLPEPEWAKYPKDPDGFPIDPTRPALAAGEDIETEKTIGVTRGGRVYNFPSIVDGQRVSPEEAVKDAEQKIERGWQFPNYDTPEEAKAAAERRSAAIVGAREKWQEETAPTVWQRVKKVFRSSEKDPAAVLRDDPNPADDFELDDAPPPAKAVRDPEDYSYGETPLAMQAIAGTDEYLAGHNWRQAGNALDDYLSAAKTARGWRDPMKGGGFAMGAPTAASSLGQRADAGDTNAQMELAARTEETRREARDRLQESLDKRQVRLARAKNAPYSPETQEAIEAVGFLDTVSEVMDDPIMFVAETALRSVPNMAEAIPMAIAFGVATGGPGFAVGAGLGEGLVEYRSAYAEYLEKHHVDTNSADGLIAAAENSDLLQKAHEYALTRSSIIGTVGTLTGGLATMPLGGWAKSAVGKWLANLAVQIPAGAIGEGLGELGAQAATLEEGETLRWGEIAAETGGGLGGAALEVGSATISGTRAHVVHRRAARVQAEAEAMLNPDNVSRETAAPDPEPAPEPTPEPAPEPEPTGPGTYPGKDAAGRPFRRIESGGLKGDDEVYSPFTPDRVYPPGTTFDEPTYGGEPGTYPETDEYGRQYRIVGPGDPVGDGEQGHPIDRDRFYPPGTKFYADPSKGGWRQEAPSDPLTPEPPPGPEPEAPEPSTPEAEPESAPEPEPGAPAEPAFQPSAFTPENLTPEEVAVRETWGQAILGLNNGDIVTDDGGTPLMVRKSAGGSVVLIDESGNPVFELAKEGSEGRDFHVGSYLSDQENPWAVTPAKTPETPPEQDRLTPAPEPVPPPPKPPKPAEYADVRLKRRIYRDHLDRLAGELAPHGNVVYQRDERGDVVGRTPSQNPQWFQDLNMVPELRMSVKKVWKAVEKAITGKRLGVREIRVIQAMLNDIQDQRTAPEEMDAARQQLDQAREARGTARRQAGLPEPDGSTVEGEAFEEEEYDAEMTAESRQMLELMTRAEEVGVTEDELERLAIHHTDDQLLMNELERMISERERTPRTKAPPTEPDVETDAGQAPAPRPATRKAGKLNADQRRAADLAGTLGETFTPQELFEALDNMPAQQVAFQLIEKGYLVATDQRYGLLAPGQRLAVAAPPQIQAPAEAPAEGTPLGELMAKIDAGEGIYFDYSANDVHEAVSDLVSAGLAPETLLPALDQWAEDTMANNQEDGGRGDQDAINQALMDAIQAAIATEPAAPAAAGFPETFPTREEFVASMRGEATALHGALAMASPTYWQGNPKPGDRWTTKEINDVARFLGVPMTGTKDLVIDRLKRRAQAREIIADLSPENLRARTLPQLRLLAADAGMTKAKNMNKANLVTDLGAWLKADTESLRRRLVGIKYIAQATVALDRREAANQPLTEAELKAFEEGAALNTSQRDSLGDELIQRGLYPPEITARRKAESVAIQAGKDLAAPPKYTIVRYGASTAKVLGPGRRDSGGWSQVKIEYLDGPQKGNSHTVRVSSLSKPYPESGDGVREGWAEDGLPQGPAEPSGHYLTYPYAASREGPGDFYVTLSGKNVGEVHQYSQDPEELAITADEEMLGAEYLFYLFNHVQPFLKARAHKAGGTLTPADIRAIMADQFVQAQEARNQLDLFLNSKPTPNQGNSPAVQQARAEAVTALEELRSMPSLTATEIYKDLPANQATNLIGKTVESAFDLAVLAQLYRDPRFETMRLIFTDDAGTIVAQLGMSTRLPASVNMAIAGETSDARTYARLRKAAAKAGATSVWLLHNHPSGVSSPSDADVAITARLAQLFEGDTARLNTTFNEIASQGNRGASPLRDAGPALLVKGHVVINHNEYSTITRPPANMGHPLASWYKDTFKHLRNRDFKPTGGLAGKTIGSPTDMYDLGNQLAGALNETDVVLVLTTNRHVVQQISTLPGDAIRQPPTQGLGSTVDEFVRATREASRANHRAVLRAAMSVPGTARVFAVSRSRENLLHLKEFIVDGIHLDPERGAVSLVGDGAMNVSEELHPFDRSPMLSRDTSKPFDFLRPRLLKRRLAKGPVGVFVRGLPRFAREEGPKKPGGDLFGDDVARQQAIANEIRRRDAKRNQGQESAETGRPGDLFSQARQQVDIEDQTQQQPRARTDRRRSQKPLTADDRRRQERRVTEFERELRSRPIAETADATVTDALTGAFTRKAFEKEESTFEWIAAVDADALGYINDHIGGHAAGDAMLIAIAEALDQEGVTVYRLGGDEFAVGTNEGREHLESAIKFAQDILSQTKITGDKGRFDRVEITTGIASTYKAADAIAGASKIERTKNGQRPEKGKKPRYATLGMATPKPVNMEAGTNYVGMIGRRGALPIDPNNNLHLGNGRVVRIPQQPVRREHVLAIMQKHFGKRIYQGRVKGKLRLGFYRPGHGEVRIKNANDIEVAAHEIAHFLDDRNPWIAELYREYAAELKEVSYDVTKVHEGFAEFMRLYLTQESMAMERAPGFYDAFTRRLRADYQTLNAMLDDVQELMHAWTQQGARARGASKMGAAPANFIERVRRAFPVGFFQAALDGLRRVKEVELTLGGKTAGLTTAYEKLRLAMGGANSTLEATMFYGTPGFRKDGQGLEFTGEGLLSIFGNWWGDHDMGMYLLARRAKELSGQGRENLMRPDEIEAWLKYADENPEAEDMARRYQEYNDRMLDFAVDSGLIDTGAREKMQEMNKDYVPFYRVIESMVNGKPVQAGSNPFMRLKGGTQNVEVIWENIVQQNGMLIHAALINDGKRALLSKLGVTEKLGKATGNQTAGLFASPIASDSRQVLITADQVTRAAVDAMGWSMAAYRMAKAGFVNSEEEMILLAAVERMEQGLPLFVPFFEVNRDPTGNVDFYMDNGRKWFFEINDPALWDSLRFMGPKGTNLVLQIMGAFSATLRRGVVAVPVFQIKNIIRDTVSSWMLSSHIKVPAARALRVVFERMSKDTGYQEMVLNGGGFANRAQGFEVQRKLIVNPMQLTAIYDRFMSRFENANRLAEYKAARAAGATPRRAALLSRDISTDFAMRGSSDVARFLAISVPFLNARMQGLYRMGRITSDYRGTAVSFAVRGAALAAATAALYALNKDDDRYKEMPEDVKDLYWVFFYGPGEDDYFLLPKPYEPGMLFGTVTERIMEYAETENGKEFADALGWIFLQAFNLDLTPQPFKPWRDLERNKDFAGTPIIPYGLENVEPSEQFMYYTSETVKAAGRAMDVSPLKMQYILRSYTGTLGTYALAASDALIRASTDPLLSETGEYPSRGETWKENIVVKGLIDPLVNEGPPRRTKYVNDLYDMVREAEIIANTMARKLDRQAADAEEYLSDPQNTFMKAMVARASKDDIGTPPLAEVRSKLNEIRKTMDLVRADKELTADEKRVQMWELIRTRNELARVVMQEVEKLKQEIQDQAVEPQAAADRVSGAVAAARPPPPPPQVAQVAQ